MSMNDLESMADLLSQADLFKGVPKADLINLCRTSGQEVYTDGQMIFDQGAEGDTVYVIQSGIIKILVREGDHEKQISTSFDGEVVGELALLDGRPRSARAVASGEVHVVVIHRKEFIDLLTTRPEVMRTLLETLTRRARRLSDLVEGNIEWLGKLARGDFEHATGFALRLAPAMFKVAPSRPLVRQAILEKSADSSLQKGSLFAAAGAALQEREDRQSKSEIKKS